MTTMKNRTEVEALLVKAIDACDDPKFHAQTYEEGVRVALEWVLGEVDDSEPII